MKKVWWLVALGIVAFAAFALVTLPAGVIASPLAKQGILLNGVTGTVWNGAAQVVQSGNTRIGSVQWKLHPLALLRGRAAADVKLTRVDGFAQGYVAAGTTGRITLRDVAASLPLAILPPQFTAGGWNGKLNLRQVSAEIVDRWPATLVGTIEVLDLIGPARRPAAMGSYKLVFPPPARSQVLAGALTDISGPLQLAGTLQLKAADRSYVLDGSDRHATGRLPRPGELAAISRRAGCARSTPDFTGGDDVRRPLGRRQEMAAGCWQASQIRQRTNRSVAAGTPFINPYVQFFSDFRESRIPNPYSPLTPVSTSRHACSNGKYSAALIGRSGRKRRKSCA